MMKSKSMQVHECKVFDVFQTSKGEIALLACFSDLIPNIGLELKDDLNQKWEVTGIGWNRLLEVSIPEGLYSKSIRSIWDCRLKNTQGNATLEKDKTLYFEG